MDFYLLLYENTRYCEALGRVMLAASKLESQLRKYLELQGTDIEQRRATLGKLINELKANNFLTQNMEWILLDLKNQRNHLAHNIYDLLSEEYIQQEKLIPEDVISFAETAEQIAENCYQIALIIQKGIQKSDKNDKDSLLLPPL
jgi:predicted transcriptional regulator